MTRNPDILHQADKLAQEMSARFPAMEIFRRLKRGPHGRHKSGNGDDFWQFRQYRDGDSPRQVDWKQTAKTEHFFIRERQETAPQTVYFHRAKSLSMAYSSGHKFMQKRNYADILWLALAQMALKSGESVSYLGASRPALSRADGLPEFFREVQASELSPPQGRGGYTLLFSDFCEAADEVEKIFLILKAQGMRGTAVWLIDPVEKEFSFSGHVNLHDEGTLQIDLPAAQAFQEIYKKKLAMHRTAINGIADAAGFSMLELTTATPLSHALAQIVAHLGTL